MKTNVFFSNSKKFYSFIDFYLCINAVETLYTTNVSEKCHTSGIIQHVDLCRNNYWLVVFHFNFQLARHENLHASVQVCEAIILTIRSKAKSPVFFEIFHFRSFNWCFQTILLMFCMPLVYGGVFKKKREFQTSIGHQGKQLNWFFFYSKTVKTSIMLF